LKAAMPMWLIGLWVWFLGAAVIEVWVRGKAGKDIGIKILIPVMVSGVMHLIWLVANVMFWVGRWI